MLPRRSCGASRDRGQNVGRRVAIPAYAINGAPLGTLALRAPGTFLFEANLPAAEHHLVRIHVEPTIKIPNDDRPYGVNISLIRLAPVEE